MMTKASSRHSRWHNGISLGLCWIDDAHHPPFSLLLWSLFGVLVAFILTGVIVAVWRHPCYLCHCHRHRPRALFAPTTVALATIIITLAAVAAWFSLLSLPFGVIVIGHGIGGKVIPAKMVQLAESQLLE